MPRGLLPDSTAQAGPLGDGSSYGQPILGRANNVPLDNHHRTHSVQCNHFHWPRRWRPCNCPGWHPSCQSCGAPIRWRRTRGRSYLLDAHTLGTHVCPARPNPGRLQECAGCGSLVEVLDGCQHEAGRPHACRGRWAT
jgi:hypothetical protein